MVFRSLGCHDLLMILSKRCK